MNQKPIGKVRDPFVCILLWFCTLGIYGIIWGYSVFQDMRDYRGKGWSGGTYLVFTLIPFLNLVSIAVPWLLPSYIGKMYEEEGKQRPISGLSGFWIFLPIIGPIIWFFSVNSHLNFFWKSKQQEMQQLSAGGQYAAAPAPAGAYTQ